MTHYLRLDDLSSEDRGLAAEAMHLVQRLRRPDKLQIDTIHEGEFRTWEFWEPRRLLENPERISQSDLPFVTAEAFYYLLPLLVVIGLLNTNSEFRLAVVEVHLKHSGDGAPRNTEYGRICARLLGRWLSQGEGFIDYEGNIDAASELAAEREFYESIGMPVPVVVGLKDLRDLIEWAESK